MLNHKLLVYVLFFIHFMIEGNTIDEIAKRNSEMRQKAMDAMVEVKDLELSSGPYSNISFDLCRPEIMRIILCEAVILLIDEQFGENINEPCKNLLSRDAYFECKTVDGIVLKLHNLHMENKILVKANERIYKVFQVPENFSEILSNPYYYSYVRLRNWIEEVKPSPENISMWLKFEDLSNEYVIALELEITKVLIEMPREMESQGTSICHEIYNRALLCRAINIRIYEQTYNVLDAPCEPDASDSSQFSCLMANEETLFMERGKYYRTVYLRNNENKLIYTVESLPIMGSLINKFALDGKVAELLKDHEFVKQLLETPDIDKFVAKSPQAEQPDNVLTQALNRLHETPDVKLSLAKPQASPLTRKSPVGGMSPDTLDSTNGQGKFLFGATDVTESKSEA